MVSNSNISNWGYQAGTYVPIVTLVGGAGNTVPQYVTNSGRYEKIGTRVFLEILLDGDGGNEGAGTGVITITLPFPASANQQNDYLTGGHAHNAAAENIIYFLIAPSASVGSVFIQNAIANSLPLTGAGQNSAATRTIKINTWYEVDP